jgi:CRP-like cAMP-binding protein
MAVALAANRALPRPGGGDGRQPDADRIARLRRFDLFSHLPERVVAELSAASRLETFQNGTYLWRQGELNTRVIFIEQGLAVASRRVRPGVDRTYGLYGPGDSMGIYAIWAGMRYPTDALVLNNSLSALCLDTGILLRAAENNPGMAEPLMAEIGRFTDAFIHKIDIVSAGHVSSRLATLLELLLERHGIPAGHNAACLPFRLTLAQIGRIADARVETVARVLGDWKKQGWLSVDAQGFHVTELDRLKAQIERDGPGA